MSITNPPCPFCKGQLNFPPIWGTIEYTSIYGATFGCSNCTTYFCSSAAFRNIISNGTSVTNIAKQLKQLGGAAVIVQHEVASYQHALQQVNGSQNHIVV